MFSVSGSELEKQLVRRVGQCVLTCPSTSVFGDLEGPKRIAMGRSYDILVTAFRFQRSLEIDGTGAFPLWTENSYAKIRSLGLRPSVVATFLYLPIPFTVLSMPATPPFAPSDNCEVRLLHSRAVSLEAVRRLAQNTRCFGIDERCFLPNPTRAEL